MNTVDPRTRSKIILDPSNVASRSEPSSLRPSDHVVLTIRSCRIPLPELAASNVLFVLALGAAKEYLVFSDNDVSWAVVRVLGCGALAVLVWWSATGQRLARKSIEVWPPVLYAKPLIRLFAVDSGQL